MSRKRKQLEREAALGAMTFRSVSIDRGEAIDVEKRSVPLVLATEAPIDTYDFERMDVVKEVIRLDGMQMPSQVPLLDSHQKGSVRHVLGSIRDLKVDNGRLVGRAYFGSNPDAVRAFEAYAQGHLTDFSVGAARVETAWSDKKTKVVTRSRLVEGSAVVAGADPDAKAMGTALRAYLDPHGMKEEAMIEALKKLAVERGAPEDLDDAGIVKWLEENTVKRAEKPPEPTPKPTAPPVAPAAPPINRADVVKEVIARINAIDTLCRQHGIDEVQRKAWVESDITADAVASEILRIRTTPGGVAVTGPIVGGKAETEKLYEAARDGLALRCLSGRANPSKALERAKAVGDFDAIARSTALVERLSKPAAGHEVFRRSSMVEIARRFCEAAGQRVDGYTNGEIVRAAMRSGFIARDSGYNTTGSFSNLLLDATNKTLLAAYDEAQSTYSMWVRTAPSVPDFKNINRIKFGELPDPEVVPENGEYKEKQTSDAKESYAVQKYGELFSITWEALVNDDLDALTRIPAMQGNAMRRKINKVCYAILTANATLADGIALFHASSHGGNLDANALAESALDTGFGVMSQQTGLSGSGTILNLRPSYLIVPTALAPTAYRLVGGGVVPTASSGVPLYGPGRARPLQVIEEGQLDANSLTAWYLAADSSQVDTVELTFLQGEESPVLEREVGFDVDSVRYKIRQTFAAKAIDYRGLYQGNA